MIPFSGLKQGKHEFNFDVDNTLFASYDDELNFKNLKVDVLLEKMNTMLTFDLSIKGVLNSFCDRCGDDLDVNIENEARLYVKFSEETYDNGEEVVAIHPSEYEFDLEQYIFEYVLLAIPSKKVHQNIANCNQEVIGKLQKEEENNNNTDPRWDQLKNLLN